MRRKLIAANWKMNLTAGEAAGYLRDFRLEVEEINEVEIVIAPPFTTIPAASQALGASQRVKLGAQNMYFEMSGAFTGEISPAMLREFYVRYVILGHSERRQLFNESDEFINKKVHAALAAELRVILCVGETLDERDAGKEDEVLTKQLTGSLAGVEPDSMSDVVIAYEPVWAIGTGRTASPEQAQDAHVHTRKVLADLVGQEVADKVRILYGGSVKPSNTTELVSQPDIDGALVGGASLEARSFADIVKKTAEVVNPTEEE